MKIALAAAALIVLAMLFRLYALRGNSQEVAQDRLTISEVSDGSFRDFIPLRARVTPLLTVYLDAIEGGRVEQLVAEDGAMLREGDLIAVLPKPELRLSVLARQTEVEQQINNMRGQELALAQTRLASVRIVLEAQLAAQKAERQYEREAPMAERGFVSAKQFADTEDQRRYEAERLEVLRRRRSTDERLQASQLASSAHPRNPCAPAWRSPAPASTG